VVAKSKRDWHKRLGEALWAYRTPYKTPTQLSPFTLAYGFEAILPPKLRIASLEDLTEDENHKLQLAELDALDEKRVQAQQRFECCQARLSPTFNKRVRSRSFQVGDQVLIVRRPIIMPHKSEGKFTSK